MPVSWGVGPVALSVTAGRRAGIVVVMAQSDHEAREGTAELLAAVGVTVTAEGKARARARLDEAAARWTPERWAALRTQLGLPASAA